MILIITAIIASLGLAIYIWQHRVANGAYPLMALCLAVLIWSVGYSQELISTDLSTVYLWAKIQYLGIVTLPVAWYYLALEYSGRYQWLRRRPLLLIIIIPIATLLIVWLSDHLMWQTATLEKAGSFSVFNPTYGPWFWVHFAYSYLLLLIGTIVLSQAVLRSFALYRWQALFLLLALSTPWVGNALYILRLSQIDLTPFAFVFSIFAFTWSILRFQLLDITPIARNLLVEKMPDIVIVLNNQDRVVDLNKAAQKMIDLPKKRVIGRQISEIFAVWEQDFQLYEEVAQVNNILTISSGEDTSYLELTISPIKQAKQTLGRMLLLRDVTDYTQVDTAYQETFKQLQARTRELEALHQMGLDLAANLDLNRLLTTIMMATVDLLEVELGALFLYQSLDNSLRVAANYGKVLPIDHQLALGQGLAGAVWELGEPLIINDYQEWAGHLSELSDIIGNRSSMGVPIGYGAKKVGVLTVSAKDGRLYTQHDVELLKLFTPSAALAIHNARLYLQAQTELVQRQQAANALHRQNEYLAALHQVALDLLNHRQEQSLLQSIVERTAKMFDATYCALVLWDGQELIIRATTHEQVDQIGTPVRNRGGMVEQVYKTGQPLVMNEYANWETQSHSLIDLQLQTAVVVPIIMGQECVGTLELARTDIEQAFDSEQIHLITLLAQLSALVLQQAQLYEAAQSEIAMRQSIQADLRKSEEQYRDLFDNANDLIQSVAADGRFLYVNQRWLDTIGYTTAEIASLKFADIVHPDYLEHCLNIFRRLQTTDPSLKMETVFVSKTGRPFTVEGNLNAQYEDGRFIATRGFFRDITERKKVEDALRENEESLRAIITSMDDLVFVLDRQGKFLNYYQPPQKGGLFTSPEQFLGKSYTDVLPPTIAEGLTAVLQKVTQSGQVEKFEYALSRTDDKQWFSASISGRNDHHGQFDGVTIVVRDISDYKQTAERLRQIALYDGLTHLPNRRLLMDQLDKAIQNRHQSHFALLFLDLDRFKIINDSLGHQIGDALLIAIARLLEGCVRQHDTVARLGGDEFVVLLTTIQHETEARRVAERVLEQMTQPFFLNGHTIYTSASIGLITHTAHYEHPDEVLRHADIAMYQAKLGGKARYELFDLSQQAQAADLWQIESDLHKALELDELTVHYQPIVSLGSGQLTALEALVRWQHPERGLLDPGVFLPVAEEAGLIVAINEWVLKKACQQLKRWHDAGYDHLRLTVNVSAVQMQQENANAIIQHTLQQAGLSPHMLGIEITERFSSRTKEHISNLTTLHKQGVGILIDDFGIGSSLESLKLFPLDYLKINQAFVQGMTRDAHDQAIITAIIAMAHSLGLKVIAEGVETAEQLAYLQGEGCDEAQGYTISPPLPAENLTQWIQEKDKYALGIDSPSKSLDIAIRAHFAEHIGYALIENDLTILKSNDTMRQWITGHIMKLDGNLVTDIFPALVGLEDMMLNLVNKPLSEPLILPRIYCPGADEFGRYYSLRVEPFAADTAVLLLIVQDVTREAQQEFALRQQLNKLRLAMKPQTQPSHH